MLVLPHVHLTIKQVIGILASLAKASSIFALHADFFRIFQCILLLFDCGRFHIVDIAKLGMIFTSHSQDQIRPKLGTYIEGGLHFTIDKLQSQDKKRA